MFLPYNPPTVVDFPPLEGLNSDFNEPILQISTPSAIREPFAVLTKSALYLYDALHIVALSAHRRSESSIEKYGSNVSLKRNYNDNVLVLQTDKNYLLVYTVLKPEKLNGNGTEDEVLAVYDDANGNVLQNGLVVEKQSLFYQSKEIDQPIMGFQLRFKLFLKISNGILDYCPLEQYELLLASNTSIQLLSLNNDYNKSLDLGVPEGEKVVKITHSQKEPTLFLIRTNKHKLTLHKRIQDRFTMVKSFDVQNEELNCFNHEFKLLILASHSKIIYYNYDAGSIVEERDFTDYGQITKINLSQDGNVLYVLFKDGNWCTLSTFGAVLFNSSVHDYKADWLSDIIDLEPLPSQDTLILTDSKLIFKLDIIQSLNTSKQLNHNFKRPVLVHGSEIHIYTGHEMNRITASSSMNWRTIKIPFEQYCQIPFVNSVSFSTDGRYLALSNSKALLVYSLLEHEWSFYVNDYSYDLQIGNVVWFEYLDLLILTTKTTVGSELIIFDFRKFNTKKNFDSDSIIFKYDFNSEVTLLNVLNQNIILYTSNNKYYNFKIEHGGFKVKIDLLRILTLDKIFNENKNFRSIIKICEDPENNDLLILNNGELIYLRHKDNKHYEKSLLFDKIEYIYQISVDEYYLFNGESLLLIKNLSELLKTRNPTTSVLKIKVENYPIILILEKGLFVTLENSLIKKRLIETNSIITNNSIFLHDLIRFELSINDDVSRIFAKYSKYKNFQYSLELLLYQTIINDQDLAQLQKLLELNPIIELNVISKCLRKIEVKYWTELFEKFALTPKLMLDQSIKRRQFKTLGILVVVFLNYQDETNEINDDKLIEILKLIVENAGDDDELWDIASQLVRFLALLDTSGNLLKRAKSVLLA